MAVKCNTFHLMKQNISGIIAKNHAPTRKRKSDRTFYRSVAFGFYYATFG